jgi:hypothetical protein
MHLATQFVFWYIHIERDNWILNITQILKGFRPEMCSGFGLDYFHNIFRISEFQRKSVVTAFLKAIFRFLHSSEIIQVIKFNPGVT